MSLFKKIAKSIDTSVADFCDAIAARFDIDKTELLEMWTKTNGGSGLKKTKKRSAYVSFSVQIRPMVIQENPDLKFGEISKEISARWKALSAEEKAKYASMEEKAAVSPEASPKAAKKTKKASTKPKKADASPKVPALPDGHFSKMKIQELRDLCKEKGFKTSGNKMELIDRLVGVWVECADHSDDDDKSESEDSGVGTPESILSPNESEEVENSPQNVVQSPENANEAEEEAEEEVEEEDLDNRKLGELKELCKSRGLEAKGSKKELIARLRE